MKPQLSIAPDAPAGHEAGYGGRDYCLSLAEWGRPRYLPNAQGWILQRFIRDTAWQDAMGPYPLFTCRSWEALGADVEALRHELISLTLVSDPFGDYSESCLRSTFPQLMRRYKDHFIVEPSRWSEGALPRHHHRNLQRALGEIDIEVTDDPGPWLADWTALYEVLIRRHGVSGIAAFSRAAFARQFRLPGLVLLRAVRDGATVGMHLWIRDGLHAYYHLGASNPEGYGLRASYALMYGAIRHFSGDCQALDLGAGAGADPRGGDGLSRFKRGWATGTRPVFLCGRVLHPARYAALAPRAASGSGGYFPAYRAGEFA